MASVHGPQSGGHKFRFQSKSRLLARSPHRLGMVRLPSRSRLRSQQAFRASSSASEKDKPKLSVYHKAVEDASYGTFMTTLYGLTTIALMASGITTASALGTFATLVLGVFAAISLAGTLKGTFFPTQNKPAGVQKPDHIDVTIGKGPEVYQTERESWNLYNPLSRWAAKNKNFSRATATIIGVFVGLTIFTPGIPIGEALRGIWDHSIPSIGNLQIGRLLPLFLTTLAMTLARTSLFPGSKSWGDAGFRWASQNRGKATVVAAVQGIFSLILIGSLASKGYYFPVLSELASLIKDPITYGVLAWGFIWNLQMNWSIGRGAALGGKDLSKVKPSLSFFAHNTAISSFSPMIVGTAMLTLWATVNLNIFTHTSEWGLKIMNAISNPSGWWAFIPGAYLVLFQALPNTIRGLAGSWKRFERMGLHQKVLKLSGNRQVGWFFHIIGNLFSFSLLSLAFPAGKSIFYSIAKIPFYPFGWVPDGIPVISKLARHINHIPDYAFGFKGQLYQDLLYNMETDPTGGWAGFYAVLFTVFSWQLIALPYRYIKTGKVYDEFTPVAVKKIHTKDAPTAKTPSPQIPLKKPDRGEDDLGKSGPNEGGKPKGGGGPQGGKPQGGKPQGGKPQGGKPQGGKPQGGTPPAAATPTQTTKKTTKKTTTTPESPPTAKGIERSKTRDINDLPEPGTPDSPAATPAERGDAPSNGGGGGNPDGQLLHHGYLRV